MPSKKTKNNPFNDDEKWRGQGKRFGRKMGSWFRGFGEGMEGSFEGSKWNKNPKFTENECKSWFTEKRARSGGWECPWRPGQREPKGLARIFWPLGLIGPTVGSMVCLVMLIAALWILDFSNAMVQSEFLATAVAAVSRNLHWFFAYWLFSGYAKYIAKALPSLRLVFWPANSAAGFAFFGWTMGWLLRQIGSYASNATISWMGAWLSGNLVLLAAAGFVLSIPFLLIGNFCCKGGK